MRPLIGSLRYIFIKYETIIFSRLLCNFVNAWLWSIHLSWECVTRCIAAMVKRQFYPKERTDNTIHVLGRLLKTEIQGNNWTLKLLQPCNHASLHSWTLVIFHSWALALLHYFIAKLAILNYCTPVLLFPCTLARLYSHTIESLW